MRTGKQDKYYKGDLVYVEIDDAKRDGVVTGVHDDERYLVTFWDGKTVQENIVTDKARLELGDGWRMLIPGIWP